MSNTLDETNAEDIHHYTDDDMPKMLQWRESLRKLVGNSKIYANNTPGRGPGPGGPGPALGPAPGVLLACG